MSIQTTHFALTPSYFHSRLCRPGNSAQAGTYCLAIHNDKLQLFDNGGVLPPDMDTDLRNIVNFFYRHMNELRQAATSEFVEMESIRGPVEQLIEKHNDRVVEGPIVRICDILGRCVTCQLFSYKYYLLREQGLRLPDMNFAQEQSPGDSEIVD